MSDQTPSTEQVRDCYATGAPNPSPRLKQQSAHLYAEFDAWLAKRDADRDREVAAKTLREAVVSMRERKQPGHWNLTVKDEPGVSASPDSWLALLADRIEDGTR